jgi:hypothetical protein
MRVAETRSVLEAVAKQTIEAHTRALVPLLIPPLVAALAESNANLTQERRILNREGSS